MLDEGRPFHAHEVLEASWKAAPTEERDFWQGLAQLAVGLTHARRGNAAGAVTLLQRGAARIRPYAPADPYGVPVARVVADAEDLARQLPTPSPPRSPTRASTPLRPPPWTSRCAPDRAGELDPVPRAASGPGSGA